MEIRPDRLERQLAGEPLRPIYLVAGAEPLMAQEAADAIRARAREEGYGEREVFDVDASFDWDELSRGLATLSLFSSRRLFELRMPTGKAGKEGSEAIRDYCDRPPPDTVLLITTQEWSNKHAGKWSEAISRVGHLVPVWPVKAHEFGEWLQARLRRRGLTATPGAVQRLAERVEGNLLAAAQEIDKLVLLAAPAAGDGGGARGGAVIDEQAMAGFVADSSRFDVFKLMEAAFAGEASRVTRMLSALRAEGEPVPALMPMVAKEVLAACGLARVVAGGGNVMSAMRDARIWDSKQALYRRAVERHPAERWERFAAECGRIDALGKGRGDGDAWQSLERLLVAVADGRARVLLAS